MSMSKGIAYLEENLSTDYNHLESTICLCQRSKDMGDLLCGLCLKALDPLERTRLASMKPGEGVATAASIAHNRMWRKRRGWLG
jgi:hypothetical protein